MAGWGGSAGLFNFPGTGPVKPGYGRILTFTLGGTAKLKVPPFGHKDPPVPQITTKASSQLAQAGGLLFNEHCMGCHGMNAVAGPLPDLRYSSKETLDRNRKNRAARESSVVGHAVVRKILNESQVRAIQAYIISRAQESAKH